MSRTIYIWVDDIRPAPFAEWVWCKSVKSTIGSIELYEGMGFDIGVISLDHDAGDYAKYDGGDYIKILDWLEETGRNYPIHIHTANPVGRQNMRRIIKKNGWKEIVGIYNSDFEEV